MRKLVVTEFMSLDGVIESPAWTMPYWNDEIRDFKQAETDATGAMLLGRVTYEGFAAAWPDSPDEGAVFMNSVRKYVVTDTLEEATWNNTVIISGNVVEQITALKAEDGGDLVVHGSAKLVETLMENGLVDTFRFLVYPVVRGSGQRMFEKNCLQRCNW